MRKGDSYTIQSVTRSEGMLKMFVDDEFTAESTGRVDSHGLQPLSYTEHRAKDSKRDLKSEFDWDKGVMRTMLSGQRLRGGAAAPHAGPHLDDVPVHEPGRSSATRSWSPWPIAARSRPTPIAWWREVKIATPIGEFDTLHYERLVNDPKDTRADVWLAKDHFNFPVRVVFDDPKRFRLEQTVVALESASPCPRARVPPPLSHRARRPGDLGDRARGGLRERPEQPPGRLHATAFLRIPLRELGTEEIEIPLGKVRTQHLRHVDPQDGSVIDVWLGIDQHYLPVKLRYPVARNRLTVEQVATSISQ